MRPIGIVLMLLGVLTMVWGMKAPRNRARDPIVAKAEAKERLFNGFLFGGALVVGGIVLLALNRSPVPVQAVPIEQWISIPLTKEAASFVRSEMHERRFPPGSGVRIVASDSSEKLAVKFDLPSDDADDCVGESNGILVFAHKSLVSNLKDKCIDLCNGSLVIEPVTAAS